MERLLELPYALIFCWCEERFVEGSRLEGWTGTAH